MNMNDFVDSTYRIETRLGAGGGGTVYKAWHMRLQKHVVIKEYKRGVSDSVQARRNEVEALKNIKNPYLPQVYDLITGTSDTLTVMEYLEGESFDSLLASGKRFSQSEVITWYGWLASALESLHSQNICHRDIKPANIMLTPSGEVCLIDFNAASIGGNSARFISRSLGYASPEQYELFERIERSHSEIIHKDDSDKYYFSPGFDDKTEFTETSTMIESIIFQSTNPCSLTPTSSRAEPALDWKRSDIYSLGAAMYHILTGKRPHERASEVIAISKLGRYYRGIRRIIEKSMKLKPTERYTSATELTKAINRIQKRNKALSFLLTSRQ